MSALNDFLGRNFLNDRGVAFGISLILLDSIKLSRTSSSSLASSSRMSTLVFTGVGTNDCTLFRLVTNTGLDVVTTSSVWVSVAKFFLGKAFLLRNLFLNVNSPGLSSLTSSLLSSFPDSTLVVT